MEQQEHVNIRIFQINQNQKNLKADFFFPHQLTVNRTHDDPCSASLGQYVLTKNDCRQLKHYNTHRNKQIPRFYIIPRFQNYSKKIRNQWKDTFNWSLTSHNVICLSSELFLVASHEEKCVWISLTYGNGFSLWMLKYIYNLNIGTNSLLSLIYTLE